MNNFKKYFEFAYKNKLFLEDSIIKLVEYNKFKPKIKTTFTNLLSLIDKWRNDSKLVKHFDLLKLVLDESGYSSLLKDKKDLENENRLENIKELLRARHDYDNLQNF